MTLILSFFFFPPFFPFFSPPGASPVSPPGGFSAGGSRRKAGKRWGFCPPPARQFVEEGVRLCRPRALRLCDGSPAEGAALLSQLQADGVLHPLPKYDNW